MKALLKTSPYLLFALLTFAASVRADCVADITRSEAQQAFNQAQQLEKTQNLWPALQQLKRAQGYVCDTGGNPVAGAALQQAMALALRQGQLAQQQQRWFNQGNQPGAFQWFETGSQYALADEALLAAVKKSPQDLELVSFASQHFYTRSQAYFAANNRAAVDALGGYKFKPESLSYVQALPAQNIAELLASRDKTLPENYLKELTQLDARKDALAMGDMAAAMQLQQAHAQFSQRWSDDPLQKTNSLFARAKRWTELVRDSASGEKLRGEIRTKELALADHLFADYGTNLQLLQAAQDSYRAYDKNAQLGKTEKFARLEADKAMSASRYSRAADFYSLIGDSDMEQQAREQLDAQTQAASQNAMLGADSQLQALQALAADPSKIAELQRQALEMQKALQQQQAAQQ